MDKKYLKQNGNTWYVRVKVPKHLKAVVGKHEIVESLKTTNLIEAQRLRHEVVGRIMNGFQSIEEPQEEDFLISVVNGLREDIRNNTFDQEEQTPEDILDIAVDKMTDAGSGEVKSLTIEESQQIKNAYHFIRNTDEYSLQEAINTYLGEKEGVVTKQTLNGLKRRLSTFSSWVGSDVPVSKVTTRIGGDYITRVIATKTNKQGEGLSVKTKSDEISNIKTFFEWCAGRGMIEVNPFTKAHKTLLPKTKGTVINKPRAWSPKELDDILKELTKKQDMQLSSLILIAMYTGMRSNEVAEMLTQNVTSDFLRVVDAKNQESIRKVPIHPMIKGMVSKLKETSSDGYLISGLSRGGEDDKRNQIVGKRFGYLKTKLGYKGRETVLHSFRHNLTTAMYNAGVPREIAKGITGHSSGDNSSHDIYIGSVDDEVAQQAIQKVDYGKDINALVDELAVTVSN